MLLYLDVYIQDVIISFGLTNAADACHNPSSSIVVDRHLDAKWWFEFDLYEDGRRVPYVRAKKVFNQKEKDMFITKTLQEIIQCCRMSSRVWYVE